MQLPDYYEILELPASASLAEVRKAYRRLALEWHPDKRGNDPYALARFALVKEAYETLINPARKEEFLQARWYAKSSGRKTALSLETPEKLLQAVLSLERSVHRQDQFRMDTIRLFHQLEALTGDRQIDMLNSFSEPETTNTIVSNLLRTVAHLPVAQQEKLVCQLNKLKIPENLHGMLDKHLQHMRRKDRWNRMQIWLLLALVAAICALIFFASK